MSTGKQTLFANISDAFCRDRKTDPPTTVPRINVGVFAVGNVSRKQAEILIYELKSIYYDATELNLEGTCDVLKSDILAVLVTPDEKGSASAKQMLSLGIAVRIPTLMIVVESSRRLQPEDGLVWRRKTSSADLLEIINRIDEISTPLLERKSKRGIVRLVAFRKINSDRVRHDRDSIMQVNEKQSKFQSTFNVIWDLCNHGRYRYANTMYQRFVDRQPRLRSLSHHDEALMRLLDGRIKRSFGNAISSKECLEAVRTLLIEHGDAYEIAEVYNQLGFTYQEVSYHYSLANKYAPDWDAQAEKYHQKALTLSWALGDIRATIQAYIGLSCLYAAQNHSMPAHTILRAALKLAIEYTDARITGIILGLLGQVLIAHQKFDRALELLVLSVKLAEAAHDIRSLGIRHGWIALVNSALGRRHAAITAVIKARDYVSEAGTKRDIDFVEFCYSTVFKLPVDMETKKEVMEVAKDGSLIYS